MSDFRMFINSLAEKNKADKDFSVLVDICELNPQCDKDSFAIRVLRIHNMIDSLHMNGCVVDSSYLGKLLG